MIEIKNDESLRLPESWRTKPIALIVAGIVAIGLSFVLFRFVSSDNTMKLVSHSYLANFIFCLTFGIGAMFFVLVQFLVRSGWSATVRRQAELISTTIPWMAMLFIPILIMLALGSKELYEWNDTKENLHGLTAEKTGYLNWWFFSARSIAYLGIWSFITTWMHKHSRRQDETGDVGLTIKMQAYSGPMVVFFALSVSFAAFDWIMSLDSDWYSTIFGVYLFAASMVAFFALMILLFLALQKSGKLRDQVNMEHFHDMGKIMFGFNMFWAYSAFSQFLLYWYADIPEETNWFRERYDNGWFYLAYALIIIHFIIPFLGFMSRHVRRNRLGLGFWSAWFLVAHWMDMTFLVMPNTHLPISGMMIVAHLVGLVGMVSIFFAFLIMRASDVPLVAVRDPRLHEALSYSNPIL